MLGAFGQPDPGEQLLRSSSAFPRRNSPEEHRKLDVLEGGDLREEIEALEHESDAPVPDVGERVAREPGDRLASEEIVPPGRRVEYRSSSTSIFRIPRAGGCRERSAVDLGSMP
jgi:hypothetical protein